VNKTFRGKTRDAVLKFAALEKLACLLSPCVFNYFRGLVIISGALAAPEETGGENILDMIHKVGNENFLIIHGDKDNAVPITNTRKAVEKLKALNANVEYIEVPGAGHGNLDKNAEIINWIKKHNEK